MGKMILLFVQLLTVILITTPSSNAAGQWYADVYGTTNYNGQLTLTDKHGNQISTTENPTGSNVSITSNATIQPPVVVVQATATLPIHAVGDSCAQSTTGTSPNQSAGEGIAITVDRAMLLSCQSGSWQKSIVWRSPFLNDSYFSSQMQSIFKNFLMCTQNDSRWPTQQSQSIYSLSTVDPNSGTPVVAYLFNGTGFIFYRNTGAFYGKVGGVATTCDGLSMQQLITNGYAVD